MDWIEYGGEAEIQITIRDHILSPNPCYFPILSKLPPQTLNPLRPTSTKLLSHQLRRSSQTIELQLQHVDAICQRTGKSSTVLINISAIMHIDGVNRAQEVYKLQEGSASCTSE